ncbi:MAG TPA: hypothetical protein VHS56_06160 [Candidatus Cybelea sp.]|nr:hypothetical protein [Candidatus Cybelea sp.]
MTRLGRWIQERPEVVARTGRGAGMKCASGEVAICPVSIAAAGGALGACDPPQPADNVIANKKPTFQRHIFRVSMH